MTDCIFCKIIAGEVPADKIYEDDKVFAFLDLKPVNRGHALVVHKSHSGDFLTTDENILADLMPRIQRIARALMKVTGASGFNMSTNNGAAAGQAVFHLHFHIVPRYDHDGLKLFPHQEMGALTRKELADEIKKQL